MVVRQEFVKRRIEKPDCGGPASEFPEDADEIFLLVRQQLGQSNFSIILVFGEDHFAHRIDAIAGKEHMLRAAKSDATGAKGYGIGSLLGCVGNRIDAM